MYMPVIHMYEQPKPYIGQLKFMAVSSLKKIDVHSASFNGWVYPDGRALLSSEFPDAWAAFGTTYGSSEEGEFNIPSLSSFIRFADSARAQDCKSMIAC